MAKVRRRVWRGLCRCSRPAVKGRSRCSRCANTAKQYAKRRYAQRKLRGLCVSCPNPANQGDALCETCRAKHRGRSCNPDEKLRNRDRARREAVTFAALREETGKGVFQAVCDIIENYIVSLTRKPPEVDGEPLRIDPEDLAQNLRVYALERRDRIFAALTKRPETWVNGYVYHSVRNWHHNAVRSYMRHDDRELPVSNETLEDYDGALLPEYDWLPVGPSRDAQEVLAGRLDARDWLSQHPESADPFVPVVASTCPVNAAPAA